MTELPTDPTARLAEYRRELDRLSRLVQINLIINSTLELKPLLSRIMDYAAELTGAESASVMLYDRAANELRFVASTSTSTVANELLNIPVPLEGSLAGTVLREDRVIAQNDVRQDPRHFRGADTQSGFATRSLLGVPMRYRGQPMGVLEAVNKISGEWTDDDMRSLEILASQSAVAIENARLIHRLQRAYDELNQLDKLKNDFIAIASHELRTPLSVILGYASFLKEDASAPLSSHAEAVLNSAMRMRNLIEDMTNLRYLKTGAAELHREHIPLSAIFQSAQQDVQGMADAKGHTLHVEMPDVSLVVVVDRLRLGMALTNLLNNAIKFTPGGGNIWLSSTRKGRSVEIVVEDSGIGIPQDQLERIFEEFHQVEDHMTRRHGGMGLGLPIAKGLVEAHGGRIWAESEGIGRGSRFIISLPLAGQKAVGL